MKEDKNIHSYVFQTNFGYSAFFYKINPFLITRIALPQKNINNYNEFKPHQKAIIISKLIINYFNGQPVNKLKSLWKCFDTVGLTELQKSVYSATIRIPYGKLSTYKKIAVAIKRPKAYRFVGTTLAKNPFPVIIPCHRVILSNNKIGQFAGGTNLKIKMIELERNTVKKVSRFK